MKKAIVFGVFLLVAQISYAQLGNILDKAKQKVEKVASGGGLNLSQDEIGAGLKEALNIGVGEAGDFLSAKDGYFKSPFKILIPTEAQNVVSKISKIPGFQNVEAELTERMNRAAEDAAVKAKPIFLSAIKQMSFQDAMNILMGNPDAATRYLDKSTNAALFAEFKPIIQASLDKVNARTYWRDATTAYNKIPFVTKTNTELDDHVTKMALVGLFSLVEQKEKGIRSNINLRSSDLLKKVFSQQDKK
jgi:uncharacterized protein (DUF302 family)